MQLKRIPVPWKGLDLETPHESMDAARGPAVSNVLPGQPGRVLTRGPFSYRSAGAVSGHESIIWTKDSSILLSPSQPPGTPPWGVLYYYTSLGAAAITFNPADGNRIPGKTGCVRVGDYVYGRGINGHLVRWTGADTAASLVVIANSPSPHTWACAAHLERLFIIGGPISGNRNTLYWSDAGGPIADTVAEWQDDVSGLTNQIKLPAATGDALALAKVGRNLAVLCTRGVYVLTGSAPSSFSLLRVSERGLVNTRAVCEWSDGFFYLAKDGLFYFDGAQERTVSEPVQTAMTQIANTLWIVSTTAGLSIARVAQDYLLLTHSAYGSGSVPTQTWLLHIPSGSWSDIRATGMPHGSMPMFVFNVGDGTPAAYDGDALWSAENIVRPQSGNGKDSDGARIDPSVSTRVVTLADPLTKTQLHRILVDHIYRYAQTETTLLSGGGWRVQLLDAEGVTLLAATALGALDTASTRRRLRKVLDVFSEAGEIQAVFSRNADGASNATAGSMELHDLWIEFEQARQRHG